MRTWVIIVFLAALVPGQVASGEIGVTITSLSRFQMITNGGTTDFIVYNPGGFQGTGTSQSILWDPANPQDFIIGGFGFIGRATIISPAVPNGSATYALITNAIVEAAQMCWGPGGQLIVADGGIDQVRSVNPLNGVVTEITTGPQPWGTLLNACAYDPATGDVIVGSNGMLHRVPSGGGPVSTIAAGLGGIVSSVAIDPLTGDPLATVSTIARFVRVTSSGAVIDLVPPGSIGSPNALDVDQNGDFVVGFSSLHIYRFPYGGGPPAYVGTAFPFSASPYLTGISIAKPPVFAISSMPLPSGHRIALANIPSGTVEGWTLASADVALPPGAGPILGMTPDALTLFILTAFPLGMPGDLFHWTWSASPPAGYPLSPFILPAGAVPPGVSLDLIAIAVDGAGSFVATAPIRATF